MVLTLRQATNYLSRSAVWRRVAAGRWRHVHRQVFVAHNAGLTERQRLWVATLAAAGDRSALLGGLTALRAHGLRGFDTWRGSDAPEVHLLLPGYRRESDPPPGVIVHRTGNLTGRDVHPLGSPPRTRVARAVVDAASWARSDREAMAIVAAAFQQRLVRFEAVIETLTRMPRARRRRVVTMTARDAAGGATALSELDFLALVRRAGLPEPESQRVRRDASGRRRYLDFYFARWRLHVEIDGSFHLDPRQAWDDMARQNEIWVRGDRVLRFPAWLIRESPDRVITDLRRALISAGYPD